MDHLNGNVKLTKQMACILRQASQLLLPKEVNHRTLDLTSSMAEGRVSCLVVLVRHSKQGLRHTKEEDSSDNSKQEDSNWSRVPSEFSYMETTIGEEPHHGGQLLPDE